VWALLTTAKWRRAGEEQGARGHIKQAYYTALVYTGSAFQIMKAVGHPPTPSYHMEGNLKFPWGFIFVVQKNNTLKWGIKD
jgi:hypothetical protein